MITPHNVSKARTNGSVRSLLKIQFLNIKYIKERRISDQFFALLLTFNKLKLFGFGANPLIYLNAILTSLFSIVRRKATYLRIVSFLPSVNPCSTVKKKRLELNGNDRG